METKTEQKNSDIKHKIIELIKIKGPIIPVQISKEINSDILMASAHLSELSSEGKVKISNVKIGGSPLYYLKGQESMLEKFSNNLHEKERKAFDMLKERRVLRDNRLEPVIRVALRGIKDFAVPLQVTYQNNKEIFWRWYSLDKKEMESLIKSMLTGKEPIAPKKPIEPLKKEIKKEEEKVEKDIKKEEPIKREVQKPLEEKKEIKEKPPEKKVIVKVDSFLEEVKLFLNKNKINVENYEIIRKNSEVDFLLEIPSTVGNLNYYCKAKNKKRVSDSDLSSAYVQGQLKKLPVLFLTKGDLTKKAKEMLSKEFKNIKINKL